MSAITTKLEQMQAGKVDWPTVRDWLIGHTYVAPKRYDDPQPGPTEERDWDHIYVDGSWDEMQRARINGLLTDDQFNEVLRAIANRSRHKAHAAR